MKKLDNTTLVPGMVLARDFFDQRTGLLIVAAGTTLTEDMIRKMERFERVELFVKELSATVLDEHEKLLTGKMVVEHDRVIERARNLMSNGKEKTPDLEILQGMVGDIQSQIDLSSNVLLNLSHIKCFDDYLFSHVVNVSMLALIIGRQLKLGEDDLGKLGLAGLLHDFGMTRLEYSIYDHTRQLTATEWEEVKRHPIFGVEMIQQTGEWIDAAILEGIADHHERMNGSGYPKQKTANQIGFFARIIAVADVYDACISRRKYRKTLTPRQALKNLLGESDLFDLEILRAFVAAMAIYPIGSIVRLNTGAIAKVAGCNANEPFRPDVRIVLDPDRNKVIPPQRLALNDPLNIRYFIEETLEEEQILPIAELLEE